MPDLSEFRQSINSNRTELLKQFSIISVAGLGFNFVQNKPDVFAVDFPSLFWGLSTFGFLMTMFIILEMFRLSTAHGEALLNANDSDSDEESRTLSFEKSKRYEIRLAWWGVVLYFVFTIAVLSAIIVAIDKLDLWQLVIRFFEGG